MNRVELVGRLTKDIQLKSTVSGKSVTEFRLAVNKRGEGADYVPCVAWEKTAELLNTYCKKGDLIGVEGNIQTRNYEDTATGKKVYVVEVLVSSIEFLQKKREEKPLETVDDNILDLDDSNLPF